MSAVWGFWIVIVLGSFGTLEAYALAKNKTTLSRFVWNASKAWPPLPFVVGMIVGFVASHFWWGGSLICY